MRYSDRRIMYNILSITWLCVVIISTVLCEKERVEDQNLEQITNELLHEIEKRLQQYDADSSSEVIENSKEDTCLGGRNSTHTIIKTEKSLDAGAVFLASPDANSGYQCQKQCCETKDCNLAVFKNKKGDTSCYMFDCGNPSVCDFVEHEGFTVYSNPNRKTSKTGVVHEDDLERLAAPTTTTPTPPPTTTTSSTTSTTSTTTTTTTTTLPTTTPTTHGMKQQVSLYGKCDLDEQCSDSYAVCLSGYCMCKVGYSYQESVCRPDCTKFQFKCVNERQPLAYPQCIAIYDKCDGIIHCKDGSDEVGCPTDATVKESNDNDGNSAMYELARKKEEMLQRNHAETIKQQAEQFQQQNNLGRSDTINNNGQSNSYDEEQGMSYYEPDYYKMHGPEQQNRKNPFSPQYSPQQNNFPHSLQNNNIKSYPQSPPQPSLLPVPNNPKPFSQSEMTIKSQNQGYIPNKDADKPLVRQRPYPNIRPKLQNVNNPPSNPGAGNHKKTPIVQAKSEFVNKQATSYNERPHQIQRKPGVDAQWYKSYKPHSDKGDNGDTAGNMNKQVNYNKEKGINSKDTFVPRPSSNQQTRYNSQSDGTMQNTKPQLNMNPPQRTNNDQQYINKSPSKESNLQSNDKNENYNHYNLWNNRPQHVSTKAKLNPNPTHTVPTKSSKPEPVYRPYLGNVYNPVQKSSKHGDDRTAGEHNVYITEGGSVKGSQQRPGISGSNNNDGSSIFGPYNGINKDPYWNMAPDSNYQYYDRSGWPSRGFYQKQQPPQPHYSDYYNFDSGTDDQVPIDKQNIPPKSDTNPHIPQSKPTVQAESSNDKTLKHTTIKPTEKQPEQEPTSNKDKEGGKSSEETGKNTQSSKEEASQSKQQSKEETESKSKEINDEVKSSSHDNKTQSSIVTGKEHMDENKADNNNEPDVSDQQQSNGDEDVIKVEKVFVRSNKGAVVALSLGLVITFMLLVFVGCRLRNIRKRLKHGRPMSSNEADYLINGMYL